ncbi:MAG: hypothetical protein R2838_08905 [Caldilineaceae bacterium]
MLMAAAVGLLLVGQPTTADKWQRIAETRRRNWPTVPCRLRPRSCWSTSTTTRSSSR